MGLGNAVVGIVGKAIDKMFPDPVERARAQMELVRLQQEGELRELEISMSAILAEAQSADPWTSRARPSFLYVMYALLLAAIPMGMLHAWRPDLAVSIASGMQAWLAALPEELWWLFGAGYLGYTGARSIDKRGGLKGMKGG
ncbi:holin family protein [Geoalkalibacter sp.]|uniref:holin family protein n=1 Tax=Geoalkalibacter sp. TaxID=3041440 RepID=UPI003FA5AB62